MPPKKTITILTATLNVEACIGRLISTLQNQTDNDFHWVIVDGMSSDRTREIIESTQGLKIKLIAGHDFGIYDALNKGLEIIEDGYYLVIGADDTLDFNAIKNFRESILDSPADIITTAVLQSGKVVKPRKNFGWLFGLPGVAGNHAVGTLLSRDLHKRFGLYSRKFPIAADQLFIKQALAGGARIARKNFIAGEFSNEGVSGTDPIGLLTEVFRVQLLTERPIFLQYILFILRILKVYTLSAIRLSKFRFPLVKNSSK